MKNMPFSVSNGRFHEFRPFSVIAEPLALDNQQIVKDARNRVGYITGIGWDI